MPTESDDPALVAGMLDNCEQEVHELSRLVMHCDRTIDTLRSQLALKERELQRLLVIEREQAARITKLQVELHKQEAAASVT